MNLDNLISTTQAKLDQTLQNFNEGLKSLRTGRANASMLDGLTVEAYGSQMPLKQVASIVVPEAQLIQITPFDSNNLAAISTAIRSDSNLGLNPADDGRVIRLPIPPLTEERRRDLAKQVGSRQEDAMISVRNTRHDALDTVDKAKKDKQVGEDDAKRYSSQIEDVINKIKSSIESSAKAKESEIMTL
jgi:ribosome recycling factor